MICHVMICNVMSCNIMRCYDTLHLSKTEDHKNRVFFLTSSTVLEACKDDFPSLNSAISLLVALIISLAVTTAASSAT